MPTHYDTLPDIAVGHHPLHGIVAANPTQGPDIEQALQHHGFHHVPGQPTLFALADQQRDGHGRTLRAISALRAAGYLIDVDAGFDPTPADTGPDIAFVEHDGLGIIAATGPPFSERESRRLLEEHGWSLDSRLGVYSLPAATERSEALARVAAATVAVSRSGLQAAVEPGLARDVTARHRSLHEPSTASRSTTVPLPANSQSATASRHHR
ncbi:hypothetical protein MHW47_01020 [Streptomyces sp. OfavH-34-F]|uniref:hypothetical protein n=1 Tax=Streptomyces sp. OfavH-34-F TaxID=2917760 RepID=UPI001EF24135|nr:hypothetical protein [Streptomyces sp. OfavH-34-F]MCG7523035.1 hypothetical protein [Streptomyces sp. OfavH-34-F]